MEYNVGDRIITEYKDITIISKEKQRRKDGNTRTVYQYKCNICGFDCRDYYYGGKHVEEMWVTPAQIKRDKRCSCCASKSVKPNINSIAMTHPYLIDYFVDKNDAYRYAAQSNKKVLMQCVNCNEQKFMPVSDIVLQGFACPRCSDGLSIGERIMYIILKDNNIDFIKEYAFDGYKYKYDFYIENSNMIIEMNGKQHYIETNIDGKGNCLERISKNDYDKRKVALDKGVEHYVYVDCKESDVDYIFDSIYASGILNILGIDKIDRYNLKIEVCRHSITKEICDVYSSRDDVSIIEIVHRMHFDKATVRKHLTLGAELGWCDYSKETYRKTKRYRSGIMFSKHLKQAA